MNTIKFPKRKQLRKPNFDYASNGACFITFCTYNKLHTLGSISNEKMQLSSIGIVAQQHIKELSERFQIKITKYVIMPNHIHLLIEVDFEDKTNVTISKIVQSLKSLITVSANKNDHCEGRKIWQRSFHDRIIRNLKEYEKIWYYIEHNVILWKQDVFYK